MGLKRAFRGRRDLQPVAGLVLVVVGVVVVLVALPAWFWLALVGGALIWLGWTLGAPWR